MRQFYDDGNGITDGTARLEQEDARHALRVLRMTPGDRFALISGGERWLAELTDTAGGEAVCRVISPLPSTEAKLRVTLYQGLPKSDKMDLIVQKAVELGAASIVPVMTERSISRPDPKDGARKQARWQKIAREASKQSGRCMTPEVAAPITFRDLIDRCNRHDAVLVPWEDADAFSPAGFRSASPDVRDISVVIGPEGGISETEIGMLRNAGGQTITLGPRILRTETAGIAAMSALLCLYGDWEHGRGSDERKEDI